MKEWFRKNGTKVIAIVGGLSGIAATVLAVKATVDAVEMVAEKQKEQEEPLTKKEIVKLCWKKYIPVAILALASAGTGLGVDIMNAKKQAALGATYTAVATAYGRYKDKVKEIFGVEEERKVVEEIAKDTAPKEPFKPANYMNHYYDEQSGQHFYAFEKDVTAAILHCQYKLAHEGCVSLADFYKELGNVEFEKIVDGKRSYLGEDVGWSAEYLSDFGDCGWLNIYQSSNQINDEEIIIISFPEPPIYNYEDYTSEWSNADIIIGKKEEEVVPPPDEMPWRD